MGASNPPTVQGGTKAMPRMTGGELAAAIAQRWPATKVIVATGYAEIPDQHQHKLFRLAKPFGLAELKQAIEQILKV